MARKRNISGQESLFPVSVNEVNLQESKPDKNVYTMEELAFPEDNSISGSVERGRDWYKKITAIQMSPLTEEQQVEMRARRPSIEQGEGLLKNKLAEILDNPESIDDLAEKDVFYHTSTGAQEWHGFVDGVPVLQKITMPFISRFEKRGYIGRTKPVEHDDGTVHPSGKKIRQEQELQKMYRDEADKMKAQVEETKNHYQGLHERITGFLNDIDNKYGLDEDNYIALLNPPEEYDEIHAEDLLRDIESDYMTPASLNREGRQQLYWHAKREQMGVALSQEFEQVSGLLEPAVKRLFQEEELRSRAPQNYEKEILAHLSRANEAELQLALIRFASEYYDELSEKYDTQVKRLVSLRYDKGEYARTRSLAQDLAQTARERKKKSNKKRKNSKPSSFRNSTNRGAIGDPVVDEARRRADGYGRIG